MKILKSQLKEWIKEEIFLQLSEDNGKKQPPSGGGKEDTTKKLKINIPDSPFVDDKEKLSKIKELLTKKLRELKFKDSEAFKKYKAKHKMRPSTKVDIGGKETTVGKATGKKKPPSDDVGGPAHPNVPKVKKQKDIKDMSDTERQKYFSKVTTDLSAVKGPKPGGDWTVKGVQNAKIGDNSVGDILAMGFNHKDYKAAYDYTQQFKGDPPRDSKIDKQTMGAADDANEKMAFDQVPNIRKVQITNADPDVIRPDHIAKTHKALEKAGSNKADAFKKLGDMYIKHKNDLADKYKSVYKDGEGDEKKATDLWYKGMAKQEKIGKEMQKLMGLRESKMRRFTVKEVRTWMKTLEEISY